MNVQEFQSSPRSSRDRNDEAHRRQDGDGNGLRGYDLTGQSLSGVRTTLNYLVRTERKPYSYTFEPPEGKPARYGEVNSVGPDIAGIVNKALVSLIEGK